MVKSLARYDAAQVLHNRITHTLSELRQADYELSNDLNAMNVERLFTELGCASIYEYGDRHHGLTVSQTRTFITLGNRFEVVPALGEALKSGRIGKTVAKRLSKVVTPANVCDWLGFSDAASCHEVAELTKQCALGDSVETAQCKASEADPLTRIVLSEVPADLRDLFDQMLSVERERAGLTREECSDVDALRRIAQAYMARALTDPDHTVPDTACRFMKVVHVDENDVPLEGYGFVDETDHAMACCDAHTLDMTDGPERGAVTVDIPEATRRVVLMRDGYRCCVGGCRNAMYLDLHHIVHRANGGSHDESNLMTLCSAHHRLHHNGLLAIAHAGPGVARIITRRGHVTVVGVPESKRRRSAKRRVRRATQTASDFQGCEVPRMPTGSAS